MLPVSPSKMRSTFKVLFTGILAIIGLTTCSRSASDRQIRTTETADSLRWDQEKPGTYPAGMEGEYIRYGYELFTRTPEHIGPEVADAEMRFAGNNLSCQNCHLKGGTKRYSAPMLGVVARYPQYRGRENTIGTIEDRINGCMERSMNGRKLPAGSQELKALVMYMKWLSDGVRYGEQLKGSGFVRIDIPTRRADIDHGQQVFTRNCIPCHGTDGQGRRKGAEGDTKGYLFPPLWGPDSFNHGAGMHRVLTAARFIKGNMPLGATWDRPILSDEEAYDVAAYINAQTRPRLEGVEKDYPDLSRKPVDCPYPPYPDAFSQEQHKLGPFQPIIQARKGRN